MSAQLKLVRVEDYLKELTDRGPNVDLLVRLAVRRPRVPGPGSAFDLYITSSYLRDIGPGKDYQSTLIYVTFDHRVGILTGVAYNDDPILAEGDRLFTTIKEATAREQYALAPGFFSWR